MIRTIWLTRRRLCGVMGGEGNDSGKIQNDFQTSNKDIQKKEL